MNQEQKITINEDNTLTVTLSDGRKYTVREPFAKDMEGLGQDLIKIKHTDTVQKLLGRITMPQLTKLQYGKLSLADAQVFNVAVDFFSAAPSAKAEMAEALAELGYLAASESEPTTSPEQ